MSIYMPGETFFKHPALSFAEYRHSVNSGKHYKPHLHKRFSIGAIDRGEVCFEVAGEKATLQPGSLALINPETLHVCNPVGASVRSYFMLYLEVDWCLKVQQSLWQVEAFQPTCTPLLADKSIYQQYLAVMAAFTRQNDVLAMEQLLFELMEAVFCRCCIPKTKTTGSRLRVIELKNLLSQNLSRAVSLNEVAADLQVNPYTLLRQFKKEIGITPHAYRLNCRIELARKLLQQGVEPAEVALECGFFDQSHLHRHFKAATVVTPGEYQLNFVQ